MLISAAPGKTSEIVIPDNGLNAAIRAALQKPIGSVTADDMLTLTNLNASRREIRSIVGLEAAQNLRSLDLQINQLETFTLPEGLTNLASLNLNSNPLATTKVSSSGRSRLNQ